MNPKITQRYKWLLIIFLVGSSGVFYFFYRMYHDDIKALKGFMASYEKCDKAISDLSASGGDDRQNKAGDAAADLSAKAFLRLSSLIKNDSELMDQALAVADLARRELDSRRFSRSEIKKKDAGLAKLAEEARVLTGKRQAAYARFQELAGAH